MLHPNQSGFKPGDSCTNQLISISHLIFSSFDHPNSHEVRGVFLDMSKAFDKVWHEGLLYKLKCFGISGYLFNILKSFLSNRLQRVTLNGQNSEWRVIRAGVPQASILGPLLFLMYVNDLPQNLISTVKLFADDVSLFSVVKNDVSLSANDLNHDLAMISNWSLQWKMSFNPDPSKQANEVLFSRKRNANPHPNLFFNGTKVNRVVSQKHLGITLDEKLSFNEHVSINLSKARKGVGVLKKLFYVIPRDSLINIYKSFVRPHLDYCDFIYAKPNNAYFTSNIESILYNAALTITEAIRGSSREKIYKELGFEDLNRRRWFRRLTTFHKVLNTKCPPYLFSIIPLPNVNSITRYRANIPLFLTRTESFKNSFFPNVIKEWNNLNIALRNNSSLLSFKSNLLNIIRPKYNPIYLINNPHGLKLLTRLRLQGT